MNYSFTYLNNERYEVFSFGFLACMSATRFSNTPASPSKSFAPPPLGSVYVLCVLILALIWAAISIQAYTFDDSGVTMVRFGIRKRCQWKDYPYCGLLPKGVIINKEPNKEK